MREAGVLGVYGLTGCWPGNVDAGQHGSCRVYD
jgi:hypothetical protein